MFSHNAVRFLVGLPKVHVDWLFLMGKVYYKVLKGYYQKFCLMTKQSKKQTKPHSVQIPPLICTFLCLKLTIKVII